MAIGLMIAFQELKKLAKEKSLTIKNINDIESYLTKAKVGHAKYD